MENSNYSGHLHILEKEVIDLDLSFGNADDRLNARFHSTKNK